MQPLVHLSATDETPLHELLRNTRVTLPLGRLWVMWLGIRSKVTWLIGLATTADLMLYDRTDGRAVDTFAGLLLRTMDFLTVWTDSRAPLH
jgi:hypothetical protein